MVRYYDELVNCKHMNYSNAYVTILRKDHEFRDHTTAL